GTACCTTVRPDAMFAVGCAFAVAVNVPLTSTGDTGRSIVVWLASPGGVATDTAGVGGITSWPPTCTVAPNADAAGLAARAGDAKGTTTSAAAAAVAVSATPARR